MSWVQSPQAPPFIMSSLTSCGVALLFLIDASGSIEPDEYALQKNGYVKALISEQLQEVVAKKSIYVSIAEWANTTVVVIPWLKLASKQDLEIVSSRYAIEDRKNSGYTTDIAQAITFGTDYFSELPCTPEKKIIDISGDGSDDESHSTKLRKAVSTAEADEITINGLPIESVEDGLDAYYKNNVITTNGFIVKAKGFNDFARALLKKLIFELM